MVKRPVVCNLINCQGFSAGDDLYKIIHEAYTKLATAKMQAAMRNPTSHDLAVAANFTEKKWQMLDNARFSIKGLHAVPVNYISAINRYECRATVTFDHEKIVKAVYLAAHSVWITDKVIDGSEKLLIWQSR